MKCGLHIGGGAVMGLPDAARQIGEAAETLGFDGIVTGDHIAIPKEIASAYPYTKMAESLGYNPYQVFTTLDWMDSFTVMGLLVPVTETVRLGTSVTIVPYRHPFDMARVVASLDQASAGRVIFGAGVGWMREEFDLLGIPFAERGARTDEYLDVMKAVWAEEHPRFAGRFVEIERDLHFAPKPHRRPHPPIWVGGESTPALRRVVRFGEGWHIGPVAIEDVRPRFDELRRLMEEGGRDYDDLEITWMVDPSRTDEAAVREYRDLGVHGLYVTCVAGDPGEVCRVMREFKETVDNAL